VPNFGLRLGPPASYAAEDSALTGGRQRSIKKGGRRVVHLLFYSFPPSAQSFTDQVSHSGPVQLAPSSVFTLIHSFVCLFSQSLITMKFSQYSPLVGALAGMATASSEVAPRGASPCSFDLSKSWEDHTLFQG
jgi:hypothetical protein